MNDHLKEQRPPLQGIVKPGARLDLDQARSFELGEGSTLETHSVVTNALGDVAIGRGCLIGIGTIVIGPVAMGDDVIIGQHVLLTAVRHDYENIHVPIAQQPVSVRGVVVESNVWIGANSTILPGVRIGHHCVVGAGSVVTKDVEPYTVVAGNPARAIKRYDAATKSWVRCPQ